MIYMNKISPNMQIRHLCEQNFSENFHVQDVAKILATASFKSLSHFLTFILDN